MNRQDWEEIAQKEFKVGFRRQVGKVNIDRLRLLAIVVIIMLPLFLARAMLFPFDYDEGTPSWVFPLTVALFIVNALAGTAIIILRRSQALREPYGRNHSMVLHGSLFLFMLTASAIAASCSIGINSIHPYLGFVFGISAFFTLLPKRIITLFSLSMVVFIVIQMLFGIYGDQLRNNIIIAGAGTVSAAAMSFVFLHNKIAMYLQEQRMERQNTELERINSELESFSYTVSHDLKSPLHQLISYAEILQEDLGPEENGMRRLSLEKIRSNASRMNKMIDDILFLSRLPDISLVPQTVNLSALARETIGAITFDENEPAMEVRISDNVGVNGDIRLLRIALANLLGNAVKFTRHRERPLIEMGVTRRNGDEVVYFTDNGIGFPQEQADEIFKPFHRLNNAVAFEGSGIGLATVRRIVERHEGKIWAESVEGEGTTFYLLLPLAEVNHQVQRVN